MLLQTKYGHAGLSHCYPAVSISVKNMLCLKELTVIYSLE